MTDLTTKEEQDRLAALVVLWCRLPARQQRLMLRQLWRLIPRSRRSDAGLVFAAPFAPRELLRAWAGEAKRPRAKPAARVARPNTRSLRRTGAVAPPGESSPVSG